MTSRFNSSFTTGKHNRAVADAVAGDIGKQSGDLLDALGRPLRDLRISVTDRCNLRCTYCMPREIFDESHTHLERAQILTFEEIERIARQFIHLGIRKVRLTGGEPLLRRGIEYLVERLARLQTAVGDPLEIALTTNGVLLARCAQALKDAGLARVTVSLDALSRSTFRSVSDSGVDVAAVLEGIAAAQSAGLEPVKVNMVVQRGVNEHEILPMAEYFRHSGVVLRFIEYMDVGSTNGWRMNDVVPAREIVTRVAGRFPLEALEQNYAGEVAERWCYADGAGEIGVIASVTQPFCHECSRARLATDGRLHSCLFATEALDLRGPLRSGGEDAVLRMLIADCWHRRRDRYSRLRNEMAGITVPAARKIEMSYIGG